MKLQALIVDDEPFARADLRHMLSCQKEIVVAGEAGTVAEAKRQLSHLKVDVVFLDIQLRGGSGFDVIPFIGQSTDIIFTSAYDEYAVRAFEINALDYILKPITGNRLNASLERLKTKKSGEKKTSLQTGPFEPDDRVFVKIDAGQLFIQVEEILAISSIGGNYVSVKLKNGENLVSRQTLKEWQRVLPESVFFRIHRSTIINLRTIDTISNTKDGSCIVALFGLAETFSVSRRMAAGFKKYIKDRQRQ